MGGSNRGVVLRQRPQGLVQPSDVELVELDVPEPMADGEFVVRTGWLGIDATVRTWLSSAEGYLPPVAMGEVVRCSGIGTVVASRAERFAVGSLAYGLPGWQELALLHDDGMANPIPAGVEPESLLAVYGATGLTAYVGVLDIGAAKAGETVVVSAAAGATGSLACQIAKRQGCRVVGIAGTAEKCRWLVDELGCDAAIDHRLDDVPAKLKELCPKRIDVYFDNVGGPVLDAVLGRLANGARVVLCGAISVYNDERKPPGPSNYLNLISRRGRMEGFLSLDHLDRMAEVGATLAGWVAAGELVWRVHPYDGLAHAVDALNALFTGENTGKIVVRL